MNRVFSLGLAIMLAVVGLAGLASADTGGRIAVGAGGLAVNADVGPFTGISGDRVDDLGDFANMNFELVATDMSGLADVDICFFDVDGVELDCHFNNGDEAGTVPAGTSYAWIYAFSGVDIEYSLTFS